MSRGLPGRTAVVSPHFDDAVLSLGAAIRRSARRGGRILIVTVFGGDPDSERPASGWDSLAGHATEGEAVRARRTEDAKACSVVGADGLWLPFSEPIYAGAPDGDEVARVLLEAVEGFDAVLVPGRPLVHRDHRWVTEACLKTSFGSASLGLYGEQPYLFRQGRRGDGDTRLLELLSAEPRWERLRAGFVDLLAKHRAVRAYASQLKWLEIEGRLVRMLLEDALKGGEQVGWVCASPRAADSGKGLR